jgi:hypothetical protein
MTRFPDFLIIGAMKSGTTTLYSHLSGHPDVYMPEEKEPGDLASDYVFTASGQRRYSRLFRHASNSQLCGEASTIYTKIPDVAGVPSRAFRLLGANVKLIYIVRDPIDRLISHHRYYAARGEMPHSIVEAIQSFPELENYSRYKMQLDVWLEHFSRENIFVQPFENYVQNTDSALYAICEHLGIRASDRISASREVQNRTESIYIATGAVAKLVSSSLYRRVLKNWLPLALRHRLRSAMCQRPSDIPVSTARDVPDYIKCRLANEASQLVVQYNLNVAWPCLARKDS